MSYDSLPPTPTTQLASDIIEGDIVYMMSLVYTKLKFIIWEFLYRMLVFL